MKGVSLVRRLLLLAIALSICFISSIMADETDYKVKTLQGLVDEKIREKEENIEIVSSEPHTVGVQTNKDNTEDESRFLDEDDYQTKEIRILQGLEKKLTEDNKSLTEENNILKKQINDLETQVKNLTTQVIEYRANAHFYSHSIYENVLFEVDEIKERAVSKMDSTNEKNGYHYTRYYDADESILMSYNTDKERYILYNRLGHEQINIWTKKGQVNVIDGTFEVSYDKNGHIVAVADNSETNLNEKTMYLTVTPTQKPTSTPIPTLTPTQKPTSTPTPTPTLKPTNTPKPTVTPKKSYNSNSGKGNSSKVSSSTTEYDPNDSYAAARDTDGDGRLTDDQFLAAMGDLATDIATGNYYGDEEITPEMQEFAEALYGAMQ